MKTRLERLNNYIEKCNNELAEIRREYIYYIEYIKGLAGRISSLVDLANICYSSNETELVLLVNNNERAYPKYSGFIRNSNCDIDSISLDSLKVLRNGMIYYNGVLLKDESNYDKEQLINIILLLKKFLEYFYNFEEDFHRNLDDIIGE